MNENEIKVENIEVMDAIDTMETESSQSGAADAVLLGGVAIALGAAGYALGRLQPVKKLAQHFADKKAEEVVVDEEPKKERKLFKKKNKEVVADIEAVEVEETEA